MSGATAVVTTGFTNGSFGREYFCCRESSQSNTVYSVDLQKRLKGQHTCIINEPGFKEGMNFSAVRVWILSRAVGQSNVSKEASNPNQKTAQRTVPHLDCVRPRRPGMQQQSHRVEIPPKIHHRLMSGR
ncbi:hypothetical protein L596_009351 [Steinernema carpocapsae]|uniref:Uncharacterized protein n=1 Tax=Steinernema carpocapsae TaxID=34508 RepID=A0A4V6A6K9_STECR|nr:hypothetical protein L596_009351 [Steinernema carpocapsae]